MSKKDSSNLIAGALSLRWICVPHRQRGSSSKPWLLQNLHPEGDGGEEHCIWDSDGASRRVGDKTEVSED